MHKDEKFMLGTEQIYYDIALCLDWSTSIPHQ